MKIKLSSWQTYLHKVNVIILIIFLIIIISAFISIGKILPLLIIIPTVFLYNPIFILKAQRSIYYDEKYVYKGERVIVPLKDVIEVKRKGLIVYLIKYKNEEHEIKRIYVITINYSIDFISTNEDIVKLNDFISATH